MAVSGNLTAAFLKAWVRASVVDVRRANAPVEPPYLLDTNVLYFLHYDRFGSLEALGEGARPYQLQHYPAFIKKLRERGAELFVHRLSLLEFARLVDRAELYVLYAIKTPGVQDIPADLNLKSLRKLHATDYAICQGKVATLIEALRKQYRPVPAEVRDSDTFWGHWAAVWPHTIGDPADVAQIIDAQAAGITSVVTDDSDWVSCPDIRVCTANTVILEAAYAAGRLVA